MRKNKEIYLHQECQQIEENNKKGKTRDLFKKIKEITGRHLSRVGVVKHGNSNGKDFTQGDDAKNRWREYTSDLYKQDPNIHKDFVL